MLSLVSVRHTDDITTSVLSSDMHAIDCSIDDCFELKLIILYSRGFFAFSWGCLTCDCPVINNRARDLKGKSRNA